MPILDAIRNGNLAELQTAIQNGENVNTLVGNPPQTPLHVAFEEDSLPMVRALLDGGALVNATDADGETPLHQALYERTDITIVRELLNRGAELEAANTAEGNTPLLAALDISADVLIVRPFAPSCSYRSFFVGGLQEWLRFEENSHLPFNKNSYIYY